jgi:hypothetical protein
MKNKNEYFGHLKLYEHFFEISSPEQITIVNKHIDYCIPLLNLYYKGFPTYTLHNLKHQQNILELIGDLLGTKLKDITSLEAAMIILSAIYHDIGMVFSNKELSDIENEGSFQTFLNENFKAKLNYQESNSVLTDSLAEWYCRWMHAKRVWLFLTNVENLKWGTIALNKALGDICESHNSDASILNDDDKFETNFIDQGDFKFCAILLRLGDILDFDNSRTPKSVYEYLDLDNPKNENEKVSKDEWGKHLCSEGFSIMHRGINIELKFTAGPEHPQIEKNIQTFLDVIEDELKKCSAVVDKCSAKWRNFKLPLSINRTNIKSQNYKKGDYRLSLDENQIIKLLAGENLYDTQFVFIRELLQNAIDTSRMRQYHELSNGNDTFKIMPIQISTWIDINGYRWVRVDDFGMGINEYTVVNHLLRKGNSYYNSDYFKIQKRYFKEKTNKDFTPISRFGIGLLSCFILGDAVEINSRALPIRQTNSEEEKIRISIQGLQSQYFMQTEKDRHRPLEMPKEFGNENGFRAEFGTSLAVRINRSKDYLDFDRSLKLMINNYVTCSPIDVYYSGEKIGVDFNETLNTPLSEKYFYPFAKEEKNQIEEIIQKKIDTDIGVEVLPINISSNSNSSNSNLKGQIVLLRLTCENFQSRGFMDNWEFQFSIGDQDKKTLRFSAVHFNPITNKNEDREVNLNLNKIFDEAFEAPAFNRLFLLKHDRQNFYIRNIQIIHNGINVPNYSDKYSYRYEPKLEFVKNLFDYSYAGYNKEHFACFGIVYLEDALIPDLSVARSIIKGFGFNIYSSIFFATKELNSYLNIGHLFYEYIDNIDEDFSLAEIREDILVTNKIWDNEKLISSEHGVMSINELKEKLKEGEIKIHIIQGGRFYNSLIKGLIEINFFIEYNIENSGSSFFKITSAKSESILSRGIERHPPLLFALFNDSTILSHNKFINESHWLAKWMLSNHSLLLEGFETYFNILIRFILEKNPDGINKIVDYFKSVLPEGNKPVNQLISKSDYFEEKQEDLPF